jgi:predicted permease
VNEAEDQPGGPKVAVLSHDYWRRRFAADRGVVGRTLTLDGEPYEIVGVMGPEFAHRRAELFVPVQRAFNPAERGNHFLLTYARLKPGVTVAQAKQEMHALGETLAREFGHNHGIDVVSYYRAVVGTVEQPLRVLMGAVALVLVIAAANVANLLLASGLARRRELAVRTALGATRGDLARQLTIESVLLAVAGGALGLVLAQWAIRTFVALAGTTLPRAASIGIDAWVLAFAAAVSLATGVGCGLWSVLRLGTRTLAQAVREGDLRTGSSAGGRRFGQGLVIAEIAIAYGLLAGAGVLVRNLTSLERRDTGFDADRVVAFDLAPSGARYQDPAQIVDLYRQLLPRLAALPGAVAAGATSHLPMYQFGWNGEVTLESGNPWPADEAPLIERAWVDPGYFAAMDIRIVAGRGFSERDRAGASPVTIISERTAAKFWPGENPIGRRFWRGSSRPGTPDALPHEVIGVARDVRTYGLSSTSPYIMYVSADQEPFGAMTVVLRSTAADPTSLMPGVRQIVASIDANLPVSRVQTLEWVVAQSVSQPRLVSALTALFAVLAGALAAVGVYGVMAYNVRRERREFGIRLALGADPVSVRRLVVVRGLTVGAIGVALGAVLAWLLSGSLRALVSDVEPTDPTVFAATGAALLVVAVLAVAIPAFQAARTSPLVALRAD